MPNPRPSLPVLKHFRNWLPALDHRVWILFVGRLMSQLGTGFTLFYAPIYFANQVGLSATVVGLGIGSGSIAGMFGRVIGGTMADSPRWGRRRSLLLSAAVSVAASFLLAIAQGFPLFLVGNLLMGAGIGLYWPPNEAVVADLTTPEQRNEAYALTRLGDTVGLSLGVLFGGALIALTGLYRLLFVIDGITFVVFFGIIYRFISETRDPNLSKTKMGKGWLVALGDRPLLLYFVINAIFTTYLALINSALPLYFTNFVPRPNGMGLVESTISGLFAWHITFAALTQLPVARGLRAVSRSRNLMVSALCWGIGFGCIWLTSTAPTGALIWAVLGLGWMAIATVTYTPSASSLVVMFAPDAFRGVYLSINSLCWAVGYFIGPSIGGWAMDQTPTFAQNFWVYAAFSILGCLALLSVLDRMETYRRKHPLVVHDA
ncbi:MFS transporter [Vacuolonema iberomarrocanum]|uniref:MFS transporter n=1 Tax=Vacuolonema iberomarrocanum TaxID=3454632 RepID=UPI0019FC0A23|nr:MFS transporter [filamentous cyanobacterium LEGE 07170]